MVKIKFLARFRDITGERSINIDHNGNITDLINILTQKYGNEFKDALFDKNGELRDYMKILVNGEDAQSGGSLESMLNDSDEVVIFQTIAGG
ncbi:MAG: MoaD/ThiS family protein [Methanobacterium sp.]|uniref:MoaD/ThiS family protein n=1 Tax=Methanobacterium sp. TaxID=2164 RepID=UPI003D658A06|nr:MoaD/ThiS family protein [Methanobacterium sp.]